MILVLRKVSQVPVRAVRGNRPFGIGLFRQMLRDGVPADTIAAGDEGNLCRHDGVDKSMEKGVLKMNSFRTSASALFILGVFELNG